MTPTPPGRKELPPIVRQYDMLAIRGLYHAQMGVKQTKDKGLCCGTESAWAKAGRKNCRIYKGEVDKITPNLLNGNFHAKRPK